MSDPIIAPAIGTIDGANVDFQVPVAYTPGTVWLFLNGQLIPRENDEGTVVELGGVDVRLIQPPESGDRVHFWFRTGSPTPGAFSRPPVALKALELRPEPGVALDLAPVPTEATSGIVASAMTPTALTALDLEPEPDVGIELVPKPVRAEEV